jgi:hypothetical protein
VCSSQPGTGVGHETGMGNGRLKEPGTIGGSGRERRRKSGRIGPHGNGRGLISLHRGGGCSPLHTGGGLALNGGSLLGITLP